MDYSDKEIYSLFLENNEDAKNIIYDKYKYIVDVILKENYQTALKLGIDIKELKQEAYYAFSDALINYREDKNVQLQTFISLCVRRRIKKMIKRAQGEKNRIVNNTFSLDYCYDTEEESFALKDMIEDNYEFEPLNKLTHKENYEELLKKIKKILSDSEYETFLYLINDFNNQKISSLTGKNLKQVDNTIQRIKQKIRSLILK